MGNVRLFTDRHGEFVKNSGTDALRVQLAVSRYRSGSTCYRWLSQFCETSPVGAISRIFIVNHANTREVLYAGMRKHEMLASVVADIIACHIMNYNNAEIYVHVAQSAAGNHVETDVRFEQEKYGDYALLVKFQYWRTFWYARRDSIE